MTLQLSVASNELASTQILLCPSDVRRVPAANVAVIALTNISYALCNEGDQSRPRVFLAIDRNLTGFDYIGLPDNVNCFILNSPGSGANTANWRKGICHGANVGMSVLGDSSVQMFNDLLVVQTLLGYDISRETDSGNLQFYFP